MKLKSKRTKCLSRVNLPLLFQLTAIIAIAMLITCASGCRTGGTWINPNGAGKIIRPSELGKAEPNLQPLPPPPLAVPPVKPIAPKIEPVKSTPVLPKPTSAKANPVIINPKPAGKLKPFSPSIGSTPKLIEGDGGCVRPLPTDDNKAAAPEESIAKEATGSSYWGILSYYIIAITGLIVLWIVYYTIKDILHMRKQGTPMTDHIKKLKKPAKGTRAERKKTIKKKVTRKKKK